MLLDNLYGLLDKPMGLSPVYGVVFGMSIISRPCGEGACKAPRRTGHASKAPACQTRPQWQVAVVPSLRAAALGIAQAQQLGEGEVVATSSVPRFLPFGVWATSLTVTTSVLFVPFCARKM